MADGGISKEALAEIVKDYRKKKPSVGRWLANGMAKVFYVLGLACDPKKSMATPSIDRAVKQREKQEKRIQQSASSQPASTKKCSRDDALGQALDRLREELENEQ